MRKIGVFVALALVLASCKNDNKAPDVSDIKVELTVKRFDNDFFSIDTGSLETSLAALQQKYPEFLRLFLNNIAGVTDPEQIRSFYASYRPVYDSAHKLYSDFDPVKSQLLQAFRYVRYYFPEYKLPATVIPVVGPMNSREDLPRMANGEYTPNFIGPGLVGISLQFYLGSDFSFYRNQYFVNNVAPVYRSRRFAKEYITADVMKLVTDDIYPDKSSRLPLIEQMVEKGKQWWLLDKFLPGAPDSVKTGYTERQLEFCRENEGQIWASIIGNENLESQDPATIQNYIGEAPFTQGIAPDVSPGNIGQWIGWQIVKKYAGKKSELKIGELLKATPREIIEEAKYKPK
ncbi:MAG: hypothetical protein ABWZ25_14725 [Chitinophagaceae bacterium]